MTGDWFICDILTHNEVVLLNEKSCRSYVRATHTANNFKHENEILFGNPLVFCKHYLEISSKNWSNNT